MTPGRIAMTVLALLLAVVIALGAWGWPAAGTLSDDDYIAIAVSAPAVFHPAGPGSGKRVIAERVERRGGEVVVDVTSDGQRLRVYIDARSSTVTRVERR